MGVPEKLKTQASDRLGEPVLAAAMIVPPGATLYKAYSPDSKAVGGGGPIVEALMSKSAGGADGEAGRLPGAQGVLAVTADRVVYLKKRVLGVGVGHPVTEWPRSGVTFTFEENGKWSYPVLLVEFTDGSSCAVFGEKRWGLDGIAAL